MSAERAAPCRHPGAPPKEIVEKVSSVISALGNDAAYLSSNGLSTEEFRRALPAAIEQLRGSRAASNGDRRLFLAGFFDEMQARGFIESYDAPRYGDDTIYRLRLKGLGDVAVIQKGCPDGAHSSVRWTRPEWAEETYLWWLCSSLTYEPGEHVAKGINRLRQRYFSEAADALDGVIFQNELCGSPDRPCPKIEHSISIDGRAVPPPCIYVMPEHDKESGDFNWDGTHQRQFPGVLLAMFNIQNASLFTGHVGFQKRGSVIRNTISLPFGPGRSTNFRT